MGLLDGRCEYTIFRKRLVCRRLEVDSGLKMEVRSWKLEVGSLCVQVCTGVAMI